ncbi:Rrf2 family transcriptional regulator [Paenibacillus filicis]|uniref:Rrf2 family transcriptional regulator n=1 Tax=Paenibacillus gyeongsangnamensis TaxID=3388067 RepID=A0ABT4QC58_9BACL|nr:Rrf2 family transcriptional regulator [Paenibacillus filicis]MCZ8514451.1 Rrf2 family transcriptional regulator [Paenibacillus filicis]
MKYSKATDYALHTMVYLAALSPGKVIGVKPLAEVQKISPTYLSKILTKLAKAGFIDSTPGVNGGYKLIRSGTDISFLNVIHAIEGPASLFHCGLEHGSSGVGRDNCLIQAVMNEAEQEMERYLTKQTITALAEKMDKGIVAFVLGEARER